MHAPADRDSPAGVTFAAALRFWLRLGFISFGGPAGQIAVMHAELVERRRWISEGRFLHALNYCMVLPGPEAQQLATYIGWLLHGLRGALAAGTLFVLPSLVLLIALAWVYVTWGDLAVVAGLFYGIKPAVVALVAQAAWRIGKRTLHNALLWAVAVTALAANGVLGVPFPAIVLTAAALGYVAGRLRPRAFGHGVHTAARRAGPPPAPALMDDDTPLPAHARRSGRACLAVAGAGLALWAAAIGAVVLAFGADHTYTDMGAFFSRAALVSFGGAYAVLPYVYAGAVMQYGWLSAAQMMDGLALGETTPGPLIMVVAFVGFLGGHAMEGAAHPVLAGVIGATVATFFTFLPSFVFILGGAPLVERTRALTAITAPLTVIGAAVVGVILGLAVVLGRHVLWPQGLAGAFDVPAAALTLAAALALMRWRRSVPEVIAASALAGLLVHAVTA